ncbi:hypothetical protein BDQ12DRAFT_673686 [Crucibulum laeve]|uniref:BSD domain-containing protein n=1 Tax=Crucibulum laeve TaxID=68775 RepID=A0A5C3MIX5_9AGAR|nr:hypothetical protein BDQ12DRAFT_673686 [Crucibulum laeve]
MNFLDTYDISGSPATPPPNQTEQSLNEEISQVVGQLGRFWGGFRKQSQTAIQAARKDLGDVVVQAQKELNKLTAAEPPNPTAETSSSTTPTPGAKSTADADTTPTESTTISREPSAAPAGMQAFFSRLQSSLPPNVVATVTNHLPETLKHASEQIDLAQMRTTLLSEIQRVQGVTRAQAEEYAHKSEVLLREAVKEAGEVLRDAVKVIPPEPVQSNSSSGLVWDGSDMWTLPSQASESSRSGKAKAVDSVGNELADTRRAVATRAEALFTRLKTDPSIIKHDPESDAGVKDQYDQWLTAEVNSTEGGIEGEVWKKKISEALSEPVDGPALKQLEESLVPSELTRSTFWSRFFFRTHQIRHEEEKRKALIQGSAESEDDFSWEDEEEESPSAPVTTPPAGGKVASLTDAALKESLSAPSSDTLGVVPSTRQSSEDSFDVVSSNVSAAGDGKPLEQKAQKEESDGDSDWE